MAYVRSAVGSTVGIAVIGGVGAVVLVPAAISAVGFTAVGIAAGSTAATMMTLGDL